jgi:diketogulonate reductase-like aldo/keto reductase
MVEAEGMGLAPWGAIGRGWFKSREEYQRADREGRKMADQPEKYARIADKLEEIASRKGKNVLITSIALAYVMHKAPYVFPIVGGRKVSHLQGNIDALGIKLSQDEIDEIDGAEPFDIGFPMNFLFGYGGKQFKTGMGPNDINLLTTTTRIETVPKMQVSMGVTSQTRVAWC